MFFIYSILRGFLLTIITGLFIYFPCVYWDLPLWIGVLVFWLYLFFDFISAPYRARFHYKKGFIQYSLINLQWYLFFHPFSKKKFNVIGDMAWLLMDLGMVRESGYLLAQAGDNLDNGDPLYTSALGRYYLEQEMEPNLVISLCESSLSNNQNPRVWLVRGIALKKTGQIKNGIRSIEKSREIGKKEGDYILNGTAYYYLGIFWKKLGKIEYANDQLLKAGVLLTPLPLGIKAKQHLENLT
jgi:tetratricopeptide (TPR) repeat protein